MSGSVSLIRDNVIGDLGSVKIGKTGYLYMCGPDRTIIVHPDKSRILKKDVPIGANKAFDKAIEGFEGTEQTINSRGLHAISSFRRLKTTGWILSANYPVKEAYATIYDTRWFMVGYTLLCIALCVFVVVILMKKYLSPLSELAVQAEEIGLSGESGKYIMLTSGGEIGALVSSFNKMLKKLFEREELGRQYRFIVDSITDLMSFIDRKYKLQVVNSAWCQNLSARHEDVIGKEVAYTFGGKVFHEKIKPNLDRCFAGETVSYQLWLDFKSKGQKYCDVIFYPYFRDNDFISHVVCVIRDITLRRESEDQLKKLSQAVEQSPVTVVITNIEGNIKYTNPKFTETTGYTKEEATGQNPRILKSGEMSPESYRILWDTILSGHEWKGELHNKKKNGEFYWESATISPIRNMEGDITNFIAVKEDITAIKMANEELAKLSIVASKTDNAVIITDKDGFTEWVNEGFTRITGFISQDILGKKPGELLQGPLTDEKTIEFVRESIKSKKSFSAEILNYHKNGSTYWLSLDVTPVNDEKGALTHFIAIESDITERKRVEAELKEAKKTAEAANQAKSEFLASMSHEIRTPMNAIIGMAELLAETPLNNEQLRYVEVFRNAGENLLNIINDILDLSKIEAGHIDIESVEFNLEDLIKKTCEVTVMRAHNKGIEFACRILPDVPVYLTGDPVRLRQILINLTGNAIKFTEKGEVFLEVKKEDPDNGMQDSTILLFAIRDTGIGIPPDKLDRIFEKFTQADSSTTRKYGGTELGLPISKRLAELMGGSITVESEINKGSTFTVKVPVKVQKEAVSGLTAMGRAKTVEREEIVTAPHEDKEEKPLNILLVDDSEDNRLLILAYLKKYPYKIDIAENGETALEQFKQKKYDLVLMDMQMPVMDGYRATSEIRKWEIQERLAHTPVIELTAYALREEVQKSIDAGCDAHTTKPIKKLTLLETIRYYTIGKDTNNQT